MPRSENLTQMLDQVTPVILTFNEEANIERCLRCLTWARQIVILDSGSTDRTREIAMAFPQVRWLERPFDTHANQWRHAIQETGIGTEWVLRLDCDYILSDENKEEIERLHPEKTVGGFVASFAYAIYGERLSAALYPAKPVLFRRTYAKTRDQGHTEAWEIAGELRSLRHKIIHDDRKPLSRWLQSQARYLQLEAGALPVAGTFRSRLRHYPPLMPFATFLYCLFVKGLVLNGRAGLFYSLQRLTAELILALYHLESRFPKLGG